MSERTQFPISLRRGPNFNLTDFEAVLDLLPQAALLVDTQNWAILTANAKAAELSGYARSELAARRVKDLLIDLEVAPAPVRGGNGREIPSQPVWGLLSAELACRDGKLVDVQVNPLYLAPNGRRVIFTLERANQSPRHQVELSRINEFWEALSQLLEAVQNTELGSALERILLAGKKLAEAGILGVYIANEGSPELRCQAAVGAEGLLPERLPAQDLIHLIKPHLWRAGKHPLSTLHRSARHNGLSYLATAPLGQPTAAIGLVALGDSSGIPSDFILKYAQALADAITAILQHHANHTRLSETIAGQRTALNVHAILEDTVQEGLLVLTPELRAVKLNRAAEMMLGYITREVRGEPAENLLIGAEAFVPALKAAQERRQTTHLGDVRLYRRSGEAFLAAVTTLPVVHEDALEGVAVVIQDLSEREQIRQRAQQLEQHALLGEVTAMFAHEVRNPINNMSTGLQLLAMKLPEHDPSQEIIERLESDLNRLEELMKSVLSFARPTDYEMSAVDLPSLVRRLLDRAGMRMMQAKVTHTLYIEPNCPAVRGNLQALEQVFINLITNAVQAMSEKGGSLTVKIQSVPGGKGRPMVEISIADTGPGIPKEHQDRLFQLFFTSKRNGNGLGLAICLRIVTAHKGNIHFTSIPGGTVFQVQLPTADAA